MKSLALVSFKDETSLIESLKKVYKVSYFNKQNIKKFVNSNYERILYVVYNDMESKFIIKLLKIKKGIVILNDFYLNNLYSKHEEIYYQHGFNHLVTYNKGILPPLNSEVINNALAIFFKNEKFYTLLKQYYYLLDEDKIYFLDDIIDPIEKIYENKNEEKKIDISKLYSSNKSFYQRQILVDISLFKDTKLHTGIQRVVRQQLINLLELSDFNYRIEPVYLDKIDNEYFYFYAREFMCKFLNLNSCKLKDEVVDLNKDDIFYGLDLVAEHIEIAKSEGLFELFKRQGVKIIFLVYDLISIKYPHFFPEIDSKKYRLWIDNIDKVSNALLTISNSVKNDLEKYITNIPITTIHLGADIEKNRIFSKRKFKTPTFLMVSTIEPRKGHEDILNAFEILWKRGIKVNLVFIGREGWMVERLINRIYKNKFFKKYLFYLKNVDDKTLINYYQSSTAFIMASYDEGFGLPIIEAARYNLPIIARDIPVFRELASKNAYYFPNTNNKTKIANSILKWLQLYKRYNYPKSRNIKYLSWKDNVLALLEYFKSKEEIK